MKMNPIKETRPLYDLKFVIGSDCTYSDFTIHNPSLLLLDETKILGHHYTSHLPQKFKDILEYHYNQLQLSGQTQIYRYEITDTQGDIRQLIGVMENQDQRSVVLRIYDISCTQDYRIIDDLDFYRQSLQQIKIAVSKSTHIREAMPDVLATIARFCQGDRVFFSLLSEDGSKVESIEEFDPREADSDKHLYLGIETQKVPWLMKQLEAGHAVKIPNVDKLPHEASAIQSLLTAGGTKADLVVPIFIGSDLIGVIGCDSITRQVDWSDTHVRFLQEVGDYLLGRAHMRQIKEELFTKNVEFSTLLEHLPHPILQISQTGKLLYANESFTMFFNEYFAESQINIQHGMDFQEVTACLNFSPPCCQPVSEINAAKKTMVLNREYKSDESSVHFQIQVLPVLTGKNRSSCLILFTDLTELLTSQQELGLMQERLKTAIQANHSFVYEWNVEQDLVTSSGHLDTPNASRESNFDDIVSRIHPQDQKVFRHTVLQFIHGKHDTLQLDFRTLAPSGEFKWVSNNGRAIARNKSGNVIRFVGTITDISERKKYETDIQYLATHDLLTGLKNRNAFESFTQNRSFAHDLLLVADMDGLKPMNDIHGHQFGDRALKRIATLITKQFRDANFVGRIGGDEFAIILPALRREEITGRIESLKRMIKLQTDLPMETNLSIGYAYSRREESFETMFQRAEDRMYKDKLTNRTSSKASVVLSLMKSLQEKNLETEAHCRRVEDYCVAIAEKMRLDYHIINELKLLAKLHDIGKIAIPMEILNKPAPLSDEEWLMMKQHSAIGARIVSASPNLDTIAEGILYHHEHWNGQGYPEGREGTSIPLTARILCVVDAYDAMTSQRSYNDAKNKEEALRELILCSGSQFDPFIVELFISILQTE